MLFGIIFQLGYNSGHIGNPFYTLFYHRRSKYPAPFHLMWPRINNQKFLDPVCIYSFILNYVIYLIDKSNISEKCCVFGIREKEFKAFEA